MEAKHLFSIGNLAFLAGSLTDSGFSYIAQKLISSRTFCKAIDVFDVPLERRSVTSVF
jgi:hypothetical protein